MRRAALTTVVLAASVLALWASPAAAQNFWTGHKVINIAHQGGEAEAPSNTMYAYERSLKLGAEMLEVDVHSTADGRLVVMHDSKVDRTTDGSGVVYEMTLEQVQALDAAHDFVPGVGTRNGLPESSYPFRGVRTGDERPPPGYRPHEFRIPTLDQILRAYPEVPINIEIKGLADTDLASFQRNADLLAELLNRNGRSEGIIVASFNDAALDRFHAQAPQIDLAPAIADVATFKLLSFPLPEKMVALQVPITFEGIQVTDADFVERAHAQDYAVHVWLSNDGEDEGIYNRLLDWNVDGIMAAEPGRLEAVLCERGVARPPRPTDWPGGPACNHRRSSVACDVVAKRAAAGGQRFSVTLRRRDEFAGQCAGRLRVLGKRGALARGRFDFGKLAPSEGGPQTVIARFRARDGALRNPPNKVAVRVRAYDAFERVRSLRLR